MRLLRFGRDAHSMRLKLPDAAILFHPVPLGRPAVRAAAVASVVIHLALILGLGWRLPWLGAPAAPHNVLEVVLVNARAAKAPDRPDVLAQANLDGGGNTDQDRRVSTPFPAVDTPARPSAQTQPARAQPVAAAAPPVMAVPSASGAPTSPSPSAPAVPSPEPATAREMQARSLEMARLEAQIRRDLEESQKRRRTEFVGARASEYRFAAYVDSWRRKIERVGNVNYPAEARRQRLHGSLQLTVVVRADGEVASITLNRSSGHAVLDEAAVRIVRLAAPFDRFPEGIRRDTDFISITRTWSFSPDDAMSAR